MSSEIATGIIDPARNEAGGLSLTPFALRFLLDISKIDPLYSPLKLVAPVSLMFFATSVLVFLIGLVPEQIALLRYRDSNGHGSDTGDDSDAGRRS